MPQNNKIYKKNLIINSLLHRFSKDSDITIPFLITLTFDSFEIRSINQTPVNWHPSIHHGHQDGPSFYLRATNNEEEVYSRAAYYVQFKNKNGILEKSILILASPLPTGMTPTKESIFFFDLNNFEDQVPLPVCFRKKISAKGQAVLFKNPISRKSVKSQNTVKNISAQQYLQDTIKKLERSNIIKIKENSDPKFEWSHLLAYSLTNTKYDPQSAENIACAPAWVNTLMMIPEGVSKIFANKKDTDIFITSGVSFFLVSTTDLVFAVNYDLEFKKNNNTCRIILNILANGKPPPSIQFQDIYYLNDLISNVLDDELINNRPIIFNKSDIQVSSIRPSLLIPEGNHLKSISYDLIDGLLPELSPNFSNSILSPAPVVKKKRTIQSPEFFEETPPVKRNSSDFLLAITAANVGAGSLNISSASRLQKDTISKELENSSIESCLHELKYLNKTNDTYTSTQGIVVWINNKKYMLTSADIVLKSKSNLIEIDNNGVKEITIDRIDSYLNLALFEVENAWNMEAYLFQDPKQDESSVKNDFLYSYILNENFQQYLGSQNQRNNTEHSNSMLDFINSDIVTLNDLSFDDAIDDSLDLNTQPTPDQSVFLNKIPLEANLPDHLFLNSQSGQPISPIKNMSASDAPVSFLEKIEPISFQTKQGSLFVKNLSLNFNRLGNRKIKDELPLSDFSSVETDGDDSEFSSLIDTETDTVITPSVCSSNIDHQQIYKIYFESIKDELVQISPRHSPLSLKKIKKNNEFSDLQFDYTSFFVFNSLGCLGFAFASNQPSSFCIIPNQLILFFLTQSKIKRPHTLAGLGCTYEHTSDGTIVKSPYYPGCFLNQNHQLKSNDLIQSIDGYALANGLLSTNISLETYLAEKPQPATIHLKIKRNDIEQSNLFVKHTLTDQHLPLLAYYSRKPEHCALLNINEWSFTPLTKDIIDKEAKLLGLAEVTFLKKANQNNLEHELIAVYKRENEKFLFQGYIQNVAEHLTNIQIAFSNLREFLINITQYFKNLRITTNQTTFNLRISHSHRKDLEKKINQLSSYHIAEISRSIQQEHKDEFIDSHLKIKGLRLKNTEKKPLLMSVSSDHIKTTNKRKFNFF